MNPNLIRLLLLGLAGALTAMAAADGGELDIYDGVLTGLAGLVTGVMVRQYPAPRPPPSR